MSYNQDSFLADVMMKMFVMLVKNFTIFLVFLTILLLMKNRLLRFLRLRVGIEMFIPLEERVSLTEEETNRKLEYLIRKGVFETKKLDRLEFN